MNTSLGVSKLLGRFRSCENCEDEISNSSIFKSLVLMGVLGLGSLLRLDQTHRRRGVGDLLGIPSGYVLSDSTLSRRLVLYPIEVLRQYLYDALSEGSPASGAYRLGWIDGSHLGKFYSSVVVIGGQCVDHEVYNFGKELAASKVVLDRACDRLGRGFVDLLLCDGLYLNAPFINHALRDFGVDVVIKYTLKEDKRLPNLLENADMIFKNYGRDEGVEIKSGLDLERMCEYKVWAGGWIL